MEVTQDQRFGQPPAPQRGWFSRNWWWFVPGVIGLPICACAGICGGGYFFGLKAIRSSASYQMALEKVKANPDVVAELGEPIEESGLPMGAQTIENGEGVGFFQFEIKGPKGTAQVDTSATATGGNWTMTSLSVKTQSGKTITIVEDDAGMDEDSEE